MAIDNVSMLVGMVIGALFSYPIWKYSVKWVNSITNAKR